MFFDMPLEELRTYRPPRVEAVDFDAFWRQTLEEARSHSLDPLYEPLNYGLRTVDTFDVTFNGYGGQPIKAWLQLPRHRTGKLPCVVEFNGYGGGRGFPSDWLLWSSAGYAHLIMDNRGQGSGSLKGDTPDMEPEGSSPHHPGFMTQGILNPKAYFYRRIITDAVRAVETARNFPEVDASRIAVTGASQGGGMSLIVSGLDPSVVAVMSDVPFLCHYRRATEVSDAAPYVEISKFCQAHRDKVDLVFHNLSYFDGVNFATRAQAHALISVGLMDEICPPSTVFAAYNYYAGPKQINVYTYNHHDGGGTHQVREKLEFLRALWA